MPALFAVLLDIVLCRRGPQDLPESPALFGLLAFWYVGLNFIQGRLAGWTLGGVAPLIAVEFLMLLGWVWALLAFYGRRPRFLQTISAVLGIAIFLILADLAMLAAGRLAGFPESVTGAWSLIRLFVMVFLIGRVLMLAIEGGLLTGFAFTLTMILSIIYVGQLFTP